MVGWLECVNMVLGWNGAMFFFQMVLWWIYIFHIWWNGEIIIWFNGDMVKFSNGESGFLGHISINGEMVKRWNAICVLESIFSLEQILSPGTFSWGTIVVGENFVLPGNYPGGNFPWDCPGSFLALWQHLTTSDTIWWRHFSWGMSLDKLVLLYLRW